jgi:hypothetical protein
MLPYVLQSGARQRHHRDQQQQQPERKNQNNRNVCGGSEQKRNIHRRRNAKVARAAMQGPAGTTTQIGQRQPLTTTRSGNYRLGLPDEALCKIHYANALKAIPRMPTAGFPEK